MRLDVGAISSSMASNMCVATSAMAATITTATVPTSSCKYVTGRQPKEDKCDDHKHSSSCVEQLCHVGTSIEGEGRTLDDSQSVDMSAMSVNL